MKKVLTIALAILFQSLYSQSVYDKYNYNSFAQPTGADTVKAYNGAAVVLERRIAEIVLNRENYFEEISVFHKKVRLETLSAIDRFNKIYIPMDRVLEVIEIKARFISPGGNITELKKENIRKLENLENKGNFSTFAIEGAETGGYIEYYYILRRQFNPYGTVYIQDNVPKSGVEIIFAFPEKLAYNIKSYNGFPPFTGTKNENGLNILKSNAAFIPALEEEPYSYYKANLMRYDYTLAFNRYNSSKRVYSWSIACNNIYSSVYALSKKEKSAIARFIKNINVQAGDQETAIRTVENKIKTEINITEDRIPDRNLEKILIEKVTDEQGAIKLFVAVYDALKINNQLVIAGNNEDHPFDPQFNGFNFLEKQLIYFPDIKKYLVPEDNSYRLGVLPAEIQGSYALFTHKVSVGSEMETLSYKVDRLPQESHEMNADSIKINVSVDLQNKNLNAEMRRVFTGNNAMGFQSFWYLINDDKKEEIVQSVFNLGDEHTIIHKWKVTNDSPNDVGVNPMIWNIELTGNAHVELAGDELLIKIGETIGKQSELYQENIRQQPINMGFVRSYFRIIDFIIPEGYEVKNIADLNMNYSMEVNNRISCKFISEAKQEGNKIRIIIDEYYSDSNYPVEKYEEFRKVINAAADFNKKNLLLSKK